MSLYAFTPQQSYCFKILKLALFWHPDNETCNPATSSAMTNSSVRLFDYSPRKRRYAAQVKAEERRTRHHHSSSRAILRRSVLRGRLRAKKRPKTSLISSLPYTTTENDAAAAAWLAMTKVSRRKLLLIFRWWMMETTRWAKSVLICSQNSAFQVSSWRRRLSVFGFWRASKAKKGGVRVFWQHFLKAPLFLLAKEALMPSYQRGKKEKSRQWRGRRKGY